MQVTSLSESLTNVILYHFCNIAATVVANTTVPSRNELSTIPEEIISGRVFLQSLTHYFQVNLIRFDNKQIIHMFSIFSSHFPSLLCSLLLPLHLHTLICIMITLFFGIFFHTYKQSSHLCL